MMQLTLALALTFACTKDEVTDDSATEESDTDTDADTDTDTDTDLPECTAQGNIDLRDETLGLNGDVSIIKAFSFSSDKQTFIYASSNPEASCELLTQIYDPKADPADPAALFLTDHCNLSFSGVGAPPFAAYDIKTGTGLTVNAVCTFGDGSWDFQGGADAGYYWTSDYYQASAWKGTVDLQWHDQGSGDMVLDVDLREWEGTFPTGDPGEFKASGKVQGLIYTEHCEGFEAMGIF